MTKEMAKELGTINQKIFNIQRQLSDFAEMLNERQQADIDYVAMETGVDLDLGEDEDEEEVE